MKKEEIILQKLNTKLDQMTIESVARKLGFITRTRKIKVGDFIKSFCLMTFYTLCSLNIFATTLGFVANYTISKQAVAKRLTPKCIDFLRTVLFLLLPNYLLSNKKPQKEYLVILKEFYCKIVQTFPYQKNLQTISRDLKIKAINLRQL